MSSSTACSGRSSAKTSSGGSSSASRVIVGAAEHRRRAARGARHALGHRLGEQRARPGGVPVIAESPRVRMSVLGIVVFALFASLFAAPLLPAGDGHRPVPGGRAGEPDPGRAGRGAARPHPRPQRQGPRRQPHLGAGHRSTAPCSTSSRTTSAPRVLTELAEALARAEQAQDGRGARGRPRQQALQPLRAGARRRRRARGAQDLDRRARRRAARRRGRAGGRAPLPVRPARRPRARLHGPDHRRGVRGEGRLAEAVHAQRQDREVRRREDLRGRPARHARARGRSRSTPRTSPIRVVDEDDRRSPATTSSSTSTSTCRPQAEQALQSGLDIAKDRPCTGCQSTPKAEKGSTVVLDPKTGGVIAMASYPTFNPADFVDGISDIEWADLTAEENNTPLNNWAIQGQYAPGSTFKPFTAVAGLESGLITPDTTVLRRRRVRGARLHAATRARSATTGASLRRGRPAPVAHRVVRLLLLRPRRPVLDPAGPPRRARDVRRPPQAVGLRQRHRHRPVERAGRPHPVAGVAGRVLRRASGASTAPTAGAPATT